MAKPIRQFGADEIELFAREPFRQRKQDFDKMRHSKSRV